jgi:ComF family protein
MGMLEWLFAPQCAACAEALPAHDGGPLCGACFAALDAHEPAEPIALANVRVAAPWRFGGSLATAIRRMKFTRGGAHLARDLAPLVAPVLAAMARVHPDAIVVPVPLHWRRRFVRGFDQAHALAAWACRGAEIAPPVIALRRTRATPPQSTLPAAARVDNLTGAFAADPRIVRGRAVILVDDVVTTGATFCAATAELDRAGAAEVIGLALARADNVV